MILGTLASVSTLSTSVGGASLARAGHLDVRRQPALRRRRRPWSRRPRPRRVGTAGRCAGTAGGRRSPRAAPSPRRTGTRRGLRTPRSPTRRASRRPASRRSARRSRSASIANRRFSATITLVGPDGASGDGSALQHLVRVEAQDRAVLERARLALGGVDHDGGRLERRRGWPPPCATSRRSGSRRRPARAARPPRPRRSGPPARPAGRPRCPARRRPSRSRRGCRRHGSAGRGGRSSWAHV